MVTRLLNAVKRVVCKLSINWMCGLNMSDYTSFFIRQKSYDPLIKPHDKDSTIFNVTLMCIYERATSTIDGR